MSIKATKPVIMAIIRKIGFLVPLINNIFRGGSTKGMVTATGIGSRAFRVKRSVLPCSEDGDYPGQESISFVDKTAYNNQEDYTWNNVDYTPAIMGSRNED